MAEIQSQVHRLRESAYPGRGIVIGQTPDAGRFVQVYWIMGRSPTSRNRVFVRDGAFVKTDTVDKSKPVDPLTMYFPIKSVRRCHVVSNGDQTDTICQAVERGGSFEAALQTRTFEPDGPNFTPRISGVVDLDDKENAYQLSILKTVGGNSEFCVRQFFNYETPIPGMGHCVTTYSDDGKPLPSFSGEPYPVELFDDPEKTAAFYWDLLNEDNRVSLLVRFIDAKTGEPELRLVNRYA